jgi:hypothetical protein
MAEIDLKQAQIFIEDGFAALGAVNNASGYTAASHVTTMAVDGFTVTESAGLTAGMTFTIAGDDTIYTIVSTVLTSSAVTSITFTPELAEDVVDNAVITSGPHSLELVIGDGNLTFTEHQDRIYKKNRGLLHHVKNGDDQPVDVSFDLVWEYLKSQTGFPLTPREALRREGPAADWVTAGSDPCAPYSVNIRVLYTPLCDDQDLEETIFEDFRWETVDGNVKDGTLSVKGKSNRTSANSNRIARAA